MKKVPWRRARRSLGVSGHNPVAQVLRNAALKNRIVPARNKCEKRAKDKLRQLLRVYEKLPALFDSSIRVVRMMGQSSLETAMTAREFVVPTDPFDFSVTVPAPETVYPDFKPGDWDYKDRYFFAGGYYAERIEEILGRWSDLEGWHGAYLEPVRVLLERILAICGNADCAPRSAGEAMRLYESLKPFLEELTRSYNSACAPRAQDGVA